MMFIFIISIILSIVWSSIILYGNTYKCKINKFNRKLNNKPDYKLEVVLTEIKNTDSPPVKRNIYNSWLKNEIKEYEEIFEEILEKE